jgi:hypothetical protein
MSSSSHADVTDAHSYTAASDKFSFSLTGSFVATANGELRIGRDRGGQGELKGCATPGGASGPQAPAMRLND